jgi:putative salt-induced outer membrane protein YdiY
MMTMNRRWIRTAAALTLLALPTSLAAQEEAPKRPWTLETDFGFVNTSGNTATTTLNAGQKASITSGGWTLGQTFTAVYGKTEGTTSAESYQARLRGDRALSARIGV